MAALEEKIPDGRTRMAAARDPLRYFGWMVRTALDAGALPLRVIRERQAQRRSEERADTAREREETRRRLAADDPEETKRILTQLHNDMKASRLNALRSGTKRKFRRGL